MVNRNHCIRRVKAPVRPLTGMIGTAFLAGYCHAAAQEAPAMEGPPAGAPENWNWHVQNTDIVQGDPGFYARYSGPNSLSSGDQVRETVSLDLFAGLRL